ncbi:MAG: social motility TPR repeat lipoprotein Tgl [Myxococcaceae bacterium]|nr:social motility TPR repeat lipoprotein Tgl [Myxococcaceae bacterium]
MHPASSRVVLTACVGFSLLSGCRHVPTAKECETSDIHYDLGVNALTQGNMQEAYGEFDSALKLCEHNERAHNALGQLLHLQYHKVKEAKEHYLRALEIDPTFTDARVNLGNLYLDQNDYAKAIELYEQALNDMRYPTPYIARANLGWAEYKRGNVDQAIDAIRSAITLNPKFCLGYRNLGTIYDETGRTEKACEQFAHFREQCPDAAEAYYREALCVAKLGRVSDAKNLFAQCEAKAPVGDLKDNCHRLGEQLQ